MLRKYHGIFASACSVAFPVAKPAAPLPFPTVTRTRTDLFLPSLIVMLKTFLTSSILVSKSSYVSLLGPGSGGPRLMPPHEFLLHPCSHLTFVFLFRSHSSLCWTISASTFSCSSLLLWVMVCIALLFISGAFRPGHRKPQHPSLMIWPLFLHLCGQKGQGVRGKTIYTKKKKK